MRFTVVTADGQENEYDGTYSIDGGGVLTVRAYDDDGVVVLSPAFWQRVRALTD
jgi:hypothetical protein